MDSSFAKFTAISIMNLVTTELSDQTCTCIGFVDEMAKLKRESVWEWVHKLSMFDKKNLTDDEVRKIEDAWENILKDEFKRLRIS